MRWGGGERERYEDRGLGHLLPLLCLPRPSPYGTSLGMRLGTTSDSTVITNEDTLFVLFSLLCACVCILLQIVVLVDIFNFSLCLVSTGLQLH